MGEIYAALRSGFSKNNILFQNRKPASMLAHAFLNSLSLSALDENSIDQYIVLTNIEPESFDLIQERLMIDLNVESSKINIINLYKNNDLMRVLRDIKNDVKKTVLVGALSLKPSSPNYINDINLEQQRVEKEYVNGKTYINSNAYQNEILPIELHINKEQEDCILEELDEFKKEEVQVRGVNGVASILVNTKDDLLKYHQFSTVIYKQWSFYKKEMYKVIKLLRKLEVVEEDWIVECDYLSLQNYREFKKILNSSHLNLPKMKSGGSIYFGNSTVLNGFRAITSAIAQLEMTTLGKAIVFVINEDESVEIISLVSERGEE